MIRFFVCITLLVAATIVPWYVVLGAAIIYAMYWHDAYELIVLGLLLDSYYGVYMHIPYYTIGACVTLLVVEWGMAQFKISTV